MYKFKQINCGVVRNLGKKDEQRFLFIADDEGGNNYRMFENELLYIYVEHAAKEAWVMEGEEVINFLAQAFLYLCNCFLKPNDAQNKGE
jgi:hypothetical protein